MIDHCSISVKDYQKSLNFYDQTLEIIGYKRLYSFDIPEKNFKTAGYGKDDRPYFWISPSGLAEEEIGKARGVHIAFMAEDSQSIDLWYKKCLELGGKDNGSPGVRAKYHPGYYGAFIIDPSGWRIEACFHKYDQI